MSWRAALGDRQIHALAWPAVVSAGVPLAHRLIDSAWVAGSFDHKAVAALGVAAVGVWLFAAFGWLVGMGLTSVVGRYVGAGRHHAASYMAHQGLRWAIVLGVAAGALGVVGAPWMFEQAGTDAAVAAHGVPYARIYWGGGALLLAHVALDAIYRGHGDTRTPMRAAVLALALNMVLDPLLIRGLGPVPGLGVAGAAWATLLATAVPVFVLAREASQRGWLKGLVPDIDELRFTPRTPAGKPGLFGLDPIAARRMTRVGLPSGVASVWFNVVYLLLYDVVEVAGGSAAQAGLYIGHLGEGVAFVTGLGWSAAASSLVSRELGAGRPDAAGRAAWRAAFQCMAVTAVWSVVLLVAHEPLAHLFSPHEADAAATAFGAAYLRIVALCLLPQAIELALDGAFGGAGLTMPPMIVGIVLSTARVPLAWWAVENGYGVSGIWAVIAITAGLRGVLVAFWFQRGTWKQRTV